jgi:hypothetical protein
VCFYSAALSESARRRRVALGWENCCVRSGNAPANDLEIAANGLRERTVETPSAAAGPLGPYRSLCPAKRSINLQICTRMAVGSLPEPVVRLLECQPEVPYIRLRSSNVDTKHRDTLPPE